MPENQNQSAEPSFEEILQFDPFGGEAEGGQEGDGGTTPPTPATPPAETGEDTAGGKGTAPPPAAAPAPPPPPKPITQEDLTSAMMRQADAIARAVTPAPQPQQPQQQQPRFNMGIPDELVTALRSEDSGQFKAGVGALVNSLA